LLITPDPAYGLWFTVCDLPSGLLSDKIYAHLASPFARPNPGAVRLAFFLRRVAAHGHPYACPPLAAQIRIVFWDGVFSFLFVLPPSVEGPEFLG